MRFAGEYVATVLKENFEDAKKLFLSPLMAIHYAHLVMLAEREIITGDEAHALRQALDSISSEKIRATPYDGLDEDLFCHIERLMVEACGDAIAGRLHTARSRNDIDVTMYRMRQREALLDAIDAAEALRGTLVDLAGRHGETVFPARTHTQPAQPTTIAHYALAVLEQLERDVRRLRAAYETTNLSPLGACAITGTGFPIDRALTSDLLGFSAPTGNTYGSIAAVDYLLESAAAVAVMIVGVGRFAQDLLLWCAPEFGYLRLADGFVQCSSIMPQKRNPSALEHARAISSKALGQALALLLAVHNTPFGDVVDTEDDLQPLVFSMFADATRSVVLVAAALRTAEFDATRVEAQAAQGWITSTELADTLVRERNLPFRTAHAIAARVVEARGSDRRATLAGALAAVSQELLGAPLEYAEARLEEILSPRHFVEVRRTPGGPAPSETRLALAQARDRLAADRRWAADTRRALEAAAERLRARSACL